MRTHGRAPGGNDDVNIRVKIFLYAGCSARRKVAQLSESYMLTRKSVRLKRDQRKDRRQGSDRRSSRAHTRMYKKEEREQFAVVRRKCRE